MPKRESARRAGKSPTGKPKNRRTVANKTTPALESKATSQRDLENTPPDATEGMPAISLYDLVCSKEGKLQSGLEFGACMRAAREHNRNKQGHKAECQKRQP